MIKFVGGDKARFCNENCYQSFKEDRACGMNYGLHRINGVFCLHREEWSLAACQCAYCGEEVKGKVPNYLKQKFNLEETDGAKDSGDLAALATVLQE
jgi:hypothetical protein